MAITATGRTVTATTILKRTETPRTARRAIKIEIAEIRMVQGTVTAVRTAVRTVAQATARQPPNAPLGWAEIPLTGGQVTEIRAQRVQAIRVVTAWGLMVARQIRRVETAVACTAVSVARTGRSRRRAKI